MEENESRRMRLVRNYLVKAVREKKGIEIYAQTGFPFYYKSYWMTPFGVWKSDTCGGYFTTKSNALKTVRADKLKRVSVSAILDNWKKNDLWEDRALERELLLADGENGPMAKGN